MKVAPNILITWLIAKYDLWCLRRKLNTRMAGSGTVFTSALEGTNHVKSETGEMLTKPFLDVCKHLLPVLGTKFFYSYPKTDWTRCIFMLRTQCFSSFNWFFDARAWWGPVYVMADKFGAAFAPVKSDIGNNISVRCFFKKFMEKTMWIL